MMHPTQAGTGPVRPGGSGFVPANPEDDPRGKDVHDPRGRRMGRVEDPYIDRQEREVRLLEAGAGGFLGIGRQYELGREHAWKPRRGSLPAPRPTKAGEARARRGGSQA